MSCLLTPALWQDGTDSEQKQLLRSTFVCVCLWPASLQLNIQTVSIWSRWYEIIAVSLLLSENFRTLWKLWPKNPIVLVLNKLWHSSKSSIYCRHNMRVKDVYDHVYFPAYLFICLLCLSFRFLYNNGLRDIHPRALDGFERLNTYSSM